MKAVNRLLDEGASVFWAGEGFGDHPKGTILIEASSEVGPRVEALAMELGVDFIGIDESPGVLMHRLSKTRVGCTSLMSPA